MARRPLQIPFAFPASMPARCRSRMKPSSISATMPSAVRRSGCSMVQRALTVASSRALRYRGQGLRDLHQEPKTSTRNAERLRRSRDISPLRTQSRCLSQLEEAFEVRAHVPIRVIKLPAAITTLLDTILGEMRNFLRVHGTCARLKSGGREGY